MPRLLTRVQAAAYCGVSITTLTAVCPVKPIALGESKRLERYDICDLDDWIDSLREDGPRFGKNWLAALDSNDDNCSR
jgi:hypothetical protein